MVGAPRANLSYYNKQDIPEPGALFRCDLTSDTCEELPVDPTGNGLVINVEMEHHTC